MLYAREQKYWMRSYIFQYISVQWWMLLNIFLEMGELLQVNMGTMYPPLEAYFCANIPNFIALKDSETKIGFYMGLKVIFF